MEAFFNDKIVYEEPFSLQGKKGFAIPEGAYRREIRNKIKFYLSGNFEEGFFFSRLRKEKTNFLLIFKSRLRTPAECVLRVTGVDHESKRIYAEKYY